MCALRDDRCDDEGAVEGPYLLNDVQTAFARMTRQRALIAQPSSSSSSEKQGGFGFAMASDSGSSRSTATKTALKKVEEKPPEAEEEQEADDPSDDEIWSALDEALTEQGYDLERTRDILASRELPPELVSAVAAKLGRPEARVLPMLVAQCSELLPKVIKPPNVSLCLPLAPLARTILTLLGHWLTLS